MAEQNVKCVSLRVDQDELRFCWDLFISIDSDNNGIMSDDCDVEGPDLVYSWSISGLKTVKGDSTIQVNEKSLENIERNLCNTLYQDYNALPRSQISNAISRCNIMDAI